MEIYDTVNSARCSHLKTQNTPIL